MGVKKLHRHGLPVGNFLLPQENIIFFQKYKKRTEQQHPKLKKMVTLVI
jgi:hypothetical protein